MIASVLISFGLRGGDLVWQRSSWFLATISADTVKLAVQMAGLQVDPGDVPVKVRQRICVWFLWKLDRATPAIVGDLQAVFGGTALQKSQVCNLLKQFRQGRTRMSDLPRCGRPRSARVPENVNKVKLTVEADRRSGLYKLCEETGLSYGTTQRILKKDLHMKKRAAKGIPHVLSQDQRVRRVTLCRQFLRNARRPGWLRHVITADESWFYLENPHPVTASKEWLEPGMDCPQAPACSRSSKKALLIAFFDQQGLVYRHWILRGSVNSDTYVYVLRLLRLAIRNRRKEMWTKRRRLPYLLHDDNASPHTCGNTLDFEDRTGIERVPHPAYSPDLAPCDFFLFPFLKRQLRGKRFRTVLELTTFVDELIGNIPSNVWKKVFTCWVACCHKCITFAGRYFEGMHNP